MSSYLSFYRLNKKAFDFIKSDGNNYWLLLGDLEAYEDNTGNKPADSLPDRMIFEELNIYDWAIGTISSLPKETREDGLDSLNQLEGPYGKYDIDEIDFGYGPADIYFPEQIKDIHNSLSKVKIALPEAAELWVKNIQSILNALVQNNDFLLKTTC